jgi:hypothetical protein
MMNKQLRLLYACIDADETILPLSDEHGHASEERSASKAGCLEAESGQHA